MKTLSKIEYVRRWLKSGKSLTVAQSIAHFGYQRLASGICRLKNEMWIIDISNTNKFAKYIMVEKGMIRNLMLKGYRLTVIGASYIDGKADMDINIIANNGTRSISLMVNKDAFADKKVMREKIEIAHKFNHVS